MISKAVASIAGILPEKPPANIRPPFYGDGARRRISLWFGGCALDWGPLLDACSNRSFIPKGHTNSSNPFKRYPGAVAALFSGDGGPQPFQVGGGAPGTAKEAVFNVTRP